MVTATRHTGFRVRVPTCLYVYKYVDQKGSAAMLAIKRSEGVTPKVNLRNPLHVGEEEYSASEESTLALKLNTDVTRKSKTGVSVSSQKGLRSYRFVLKNAYGDFIKVLDALVLGHEDLLLSCCFINFLSQLVSLVFSCS